MLTDKQVVEIFEHRANGLSYRQIAPLYELSHEAISQIIRREIYAQVKIEPALLLAAAKNAAGPKSARKWSGIMEANLHREAGLNQTETAEKMGVHQTTISKWLKAFDKLEEIKA